MPALAWVNGRFGPIAALGVPVEDRGLQFADAVYEVVAVLAGTPFDWAPHAERLQRNLAALRIEGAPSARALELVVRSLLGRARIDDGLLHLQVTRGVARRDHAFPPRTRPTVAITVRPFDFRRRLGLQREGVTAISRPDPRWKRCDLKTTNLLGAVLAKEDARNQGAFEALFLDPQGHVTEGASTNVWLVDRAGRLVTHPPTAAILAGVARGTLLRLARAQGYTVDERPFTLHEAQRAAELFLTSTTAPVIPIVRLDGAEIGQGRPGPVARHLAQLMWAEVARQTGWRP
ncbi:MAG: aminotransferase class IV [Sphingomonadaceae bacterium]|uniref:aminotransferase class IV n=1 Tax=Thermaurantiacus sp. TaxID=2820283 RepID=UPI00298F2A16|nr:aminotransferase class IV [Thermaurantiacus sp.]MCS6986277.1 aminotransferase class IV [Sphingomonadaceae bacterium]MDW8415726.1 aminotransferase class IV [Thermaurantiacus sp.]